MASSTLNSGIKGAEFNAFLLKIADEITNDELLRMKFLCEDDLPKGKLASIDTPSELLNFLRNSGKIGPEDVTYLVTLLEGVHKHQLANRVLDEGPATAAGVDNVENLPCLTALFTGREAVVNEIIQKLTQVTRPSRMISIVSIPGMGKTQVAIQVSRLLESEFNKTVIFIEKQEKLIDICSEILRRLSGRRWSERHDLVSMTKRKLRELQEHKVIVLDNTEDVQGKEFDNFAEHVLQYAPSVQLIVTTREDVGFSSLNIHKVPLDPLDPDSSVKLLQQAVIDCEEQHVKELGKLCGGIPLVLEHCACLLKDCFSPEILIRELRDNPIQLLKTNAEGVYKALGRFLGKFSNKIRENLVRASIFPSAFSVKDIEFLFDDLLELETVKTKMMRCSLLRKINKEKFDLHPLVREFCRAERRLLNMGDVGEAAQHKFNHHYLTRLKSLSKQFISKDLTLDAISAFRDEKANIMEAFGNCLHDKSDVCEKEFGIDVANSTEVLDFLAKVLSPPAECTKLYQRCCDIVEESGDKKRLADSLNSLGFRRLCDVAHRKGNRDTLVMFQRAYDIRMKLPKEQQQSETHAHTICKLGLCYSLQGEEERGRKLIKEGIEMREKLGVRLYMAAGYCDLGNTYRECRDHKAAIDIWKTETLPVYKSELGDHPWTASILRYMASSYKALATGSPADPGMVDQAEMYSREALELRIKLLGVHQDTARSHVDLCEVLMIKKDYKSALEELEKALEIQKDVLGDQHKTTMDSLKIKMTILTMVGSGTD